MDKKKIEAYKSELEKVIKKEKKKKQKIERNCSPDKKLEILPKNTNDNLEEKHELEEKQQSVISDVAEGVAVVANVISEVSKVVADVATDIAVLTKEESPCKNTSLEFSPKLNFSPSPRDVRDYIVKVADSAYNSIKEKVVKPVVNKINNIFDRPMASRIPTGRRHNPITPVVVVVEKPVIIYKKKDLSQWCSSVKNQGNVGSCTAFSFIGLMEYNYNKYSSEKNDGDDIFSERFLYYITRVKIEKVSPSRDDGAYIRDVLKAGKLFGVCKEASCPYVSSDGLIHYDQQPSDNMYDEAQKFQILQYARIDENNFLNTCRVLLENERPFVAGFMCFENLHSNKNGVIPLPAGRMTGGHAVLFVGYDDEKKLLKFKNSWGIEWGDKGYGYLPYYFAEKGLLQDAWTVYRQEHNDISIGVSKPTDI